MDQVLDRAEKSGWEMTVVMHREISAELQVLVRKGNQPIGG